MAERYRPSPGQKFYMKGGGEPDFPFYEFQGPETMPVEEALKRGYKLPFYADLTSMPETERRVIWGMMVGNEGKTRTPVYKAYNDAGFDPVARRAPELRRRLALRSVPAAGAAVLRHSRRHGQRLAT